MGILEAYQVRLDKTKTEFYMLYIMHIFILLSKPTNAHTIYKHVLALVLMQMYTYK
jgi:hypothetical protein